MSSTIASRINWQLQNLYCNGVQVANRFRSYSPADCVIICGSGRSGTTWLAEILSTLDHATLLDEPLKRPDSKRLQRIGFSGAGQYLPQGKCDWPEAYAYFNDLLNGREFNPNHLHGKVSNVWSTEIWVLKFIRAHLLLPWLVDNYNVRKPIYLIRNPYAVIASQFRHPAWNHTLVKYKKPTSLFSEYFNQFEPIYSQIKNNIQFKAFGWALENSFLIKHPYHNKKWLTVSYENLFQQPMLTLEVIFKELNLVLTDKIRNSVSRQSYSAPTEIASQNQQLEKWKAHLKATEIDDISEILEKFELHSFIYNG